MDRKPNVRALMRGIGPSMALMEVTEFEALGSWSLVVDDEIVLFADHDTARDVLVLSAEVATPAEASRLRLYDLLLQYNNRWAETGGARMALDGEGGAAVQLFDLALEGLDQPRLEAVLAAFLDTLRAWREIVAHEPAVQDAPFSIPGLHVIRG